MWPLAVVSEEILHLVGSRVSVPVILSLTIGTCGGSGEAETDKVNINTLANVSPSHQNRKVSAGNRNVVRAKTCADSSLGNSLSQPLRYLPAPLDLNFF